MPEGLKPSTISPLRQAIRKARSQMKESTGHWGKYPKPGEAIGNIGLLNYAHFLFQQLRITRMRDKQLVTFRSKFAKNPLYCRANTSDNLVFSQVFMFREYQCLDDVPHASLIIDCGANVGYSAAYFLTRYPSATLIAVEPDRGNLEVLQANLRCFGNRATALHTGVWSHPAVLTMSDEHYRGGVGGIEWARTVRECRPDEGSVGFTATDISTLLDQSGHDRISILKIDIEGAEAVVFATNFEPWIDRVDTLVIELHSDSAFGDPTSVFHSAIKDRGFSLSTFGELTICRRWR